jgi:excinuclease UvrABC ATPase subunit
MDKIEVRGARTHNLKNINLIIPRDKLIVVTGLSGSGKSSLAFDTCMPKDSVVTLNRSLRTRVSSCR